MLAEDARARTETVNACCNHPKRIFYLLPSLLLASVDREDEQRAALGGRSDHFFADEADEGRDRDRATDDNRDILLAVHRIGDGASADARAEILLPQLLAGLGVERAEVAVQVAPENEVAAGRQRAAVERQIGLHTPDLLVLDGIPRDQLSEIAARAVVRGKFAAEIEDAPLVGDVADRPVHADV